MKSGYDQFFKKAQNFSQHGDAKKKTENKKLRKDLDPQWLSRLSVKKKTRPKKPIKSLVVSAFGLCATLAALFYFEEIEQFVNKIEVKALGTAIAQEPGAKEKGQSQNKDQGKEESKESEKGVEKETPKAEKKSEDHASKDQKVQEEGDAPKPKVFSEEEINHLKKLNDRKKELDQREEELSKMEAELQSQKEELEKRLNELNAVRTDIAKVLDDRVKADDKKVETLVQMYSNMRPNTAAKVLETLDEDLAVEVVGRMKKKNAADIMNLLKPEKAQAISEKYAGYKRK